MRPPAHVEVRGAHPGVAGPDGSPSYIPFDVDWLDDRGDILLHVNPRPDEGIVVLNSCMDGAWQEELVVDRYPFALEPDAEVTLRFDVLREHFQISTPDGQLCVFPHRRPPSAIVEVRSSAPLRVVERAG